MVNYIRSVIFGIIFAIVLLIGDIYSFLIMVISLFTKSKRFWTIVLAKDQAFNASIGGSEDETLSSRAGRANIRGDKWACVLCKILDYIQKDHCKNAIGD